MAVRSGTIRMLGLVGVEVNVSRKRITRVMVFGVWPVKNKPSYYVAIRQSLLMKMHNSYYLL